MGQRSAVSARSGRLRTRGAKQSPNTGEEWLASGAITSLGTFAEKIPARNFRKISALAAVHGGNRAACRAKPKSLQVCFSERSNYYTAQKDADGEAEALHSLASIARREAIARRRLNLLEKAENLVGRRFGSQDEMRKHARALSDCERRVDRSRATISAARSNSLKNNSNERYFRLITHNLALPSGLRGDFGEALRWFKRIFREDKPEAQLPQEAIGHLNVARLHLYRGEFAETEKHLGKALELCQLYNLKHLRGEIFESLR